MSFCRAQCEQSFKMRIFCGETQRHIDHVNRVNNPVSNGNAGGSRTLGGGAGGAGGGGGGVSGSKRRHHSIKHEKGAGPTEKRPSPSTTGDPSMIIITPELWSRGASNHATPGSPIAPHLTPLPHARGTSTSATTPTSKPLGLHRPVSQRAYGDQRKSRHPANRKHLDRRQRSRVSSGLASTASTGSRGRFFNGMPRPLPPPLPQQPHSVQHSLHRHSSRQIPPPPPPPPHQHPHTPQHLHPPQHPHTPQQPHPQSLPQQPPQQLPPHLLPPISGNRFGVPPTTILVPYAVAVPLPIPVPIPIPVPDSWVYDFNPPTTRSGATPATPTTAAGVNRSTSRVGEWCGVRSSSADLSVPPTETYGDGQPEPMDLSVAGVGGARSPIEARRYTPLSCETGVSEGQPDVEDVDVEDHGDHDDHQLDHDDDDYDDEARAHGPYTPPPRIQAYATSLVTSLATPLATPQLATPLATPQLACTGSSLVSSYSARRSRILDATPSANHVTSSQSVIRPQMPANHAYPARNHATLATRNRRFSSTSGSGGGADEKRRCLQRVQHVKSK